jgi:hypothetical protein
MTVLSWTSQARRQDGSPYGRPTKRHVSVDGAVTVCGFTVPQDAATVAVTPGWHELANCYNCVYRLWPDHAPPGYARPASGSDFPLRRECPHSPGRGADPRSCPECAHGPDDPWAGFDAAGHIIPQPRETAEARSPDDRKAADRMHGDQDMLGPHTHEVNAQAALSDGDPAAAQVLAILALASAVNRLAAAQEAAAARPPAP